MLVGVALLGIGAAGMGLILRLRLGRFKGWADAIVAQAEKQAQERERECTLQCEKKRVEAQSSIEARRQEVETQLGRRAEHLEKQTATLTDRLADVDARLVQVRKQEEAIQGQQQGLIAQLEAVAGLSQSEACAQLVQSKRQLIDRELREWKAKKERETQTDANRKAQQILATSLSRIALDTVSETTAITIALPNEEMKARIIGRDGRNVRSLEQATGCNIIIDDTPRAVTISGFDPVRKAVAKAALGQLIADGRIHPTRIQEHVAKARRSIEENTVVRGEEASLQAGVNGLHPELLKSLGQLAFRQSYGQNVLEHSIEVSALMGMMAAELGLNEPLARRIGLLHDIGKTTDHQMPGSHARIGHTLALRYGEDEAVAFGIGSHHHEMAATTIEGSLCSTADTLSAARPGARTEQVEHYIQRLSKLEEIAHQMPGVFKAYALQAGRELRLIVEPQKVRDTELRKLAQTVAQKIEASLTYPGQIRVTVVRETRCIEVAR